MGTTCHLCGGRGWVKIGGKNVRCPGEKAHKGNKVLVPVLPAISSISGGTVPQSVEDAYDKMRMSSLPATDQGNHPDEDTNGLSLDDLVTFHLLGGTADTTTITKVLRETFTQEEATCDETTALLLQQLDAETIFQAVTTVVSREDAPWVNIVAQANICANVEQACLTHRLVSPENKKTLRIYGIGNFEHIARYEYTPPHILDVLSRVGSEDVRSLVARNPHTPAATLTRMVDGETSSTVLASIALHLNTPPETLEVLADSEDVWILEAVISHPNATEQILLRIKTTCRQVGENYADYHVDSTSITAQQLEEYAHEAVEILESTGIGKEPRGDRHGMVFIRTTARTRLGRIARHPNTPPRVLAYLAEHGNGDTVAEVAKNPRTPTETLQRLADDTNHTYDENLAQNPSTPVRILERYAEFHSPGVQACVAHNPATPAKILTQLAPRGGEVTVIVAGNPNTPPEILDKIQESLPGNSIETRSIIANLGRNPHTPAETLQRIADTSPAYAIHVAANPHTPERALLNMAYHPDKYCDAVIEMLKHREHIPAEVMGVLGQQNWGDFSPRGGFNIGHAVVCRAGTAQYEDYLLFRRAEQM